MSKFMLLSATTTLLLAGSAWAQTAPPPAMANVQAPAPQQPPARPTVDSPIEALVAHPASKAVLEAHLPGIDRHPAYDQFKGMTLRQVAPWSEGAVNDRIIAAIDAGLKALPAG